MSRGIVTKELSSCLALYPLYRLRVEELLKFIVELEITS